MAPLHPHALPRPRLPSTPARPILQSRNPRSTPSSRPPSTPSTPSGPESGPSLRHDLDLTHLAAFPSLLHPHPHLDTGITYDTAPSWATPHATRVTVHNALRTFFPAHAHARASGEDAAGVEMEKEEGAVGLLKGTVRSLPRSTPAYGALAALHMYRVGFRSAQHQSAKGRMRRNATVLIVGNGAGLVGFGEGKADTGDAAHAAAYRQAVRSLDLVQRFERRTIWHEVELKFGATRVVLRPRPLGFGLRCGPVMHQVCKAAGIKDVSGEVWGSKNPMNVIKATCLALWGSEARPGMGDGVGGGGRRTEKGMGGRSREDIERARGRNLQVL